MPAYSRGAYYERKLRHALEKEGWYVVRSAGSKGGLDLVGIKDGEVIGIQVKKGETISREERKQLQELRKRLGIKIFVVYFRERSEGVWEEIHPTKGGNGNAFI